MLPGLVKYLFLLLHSSLLAHVSNELCEAVMNFLTTLLVLGLNKSIVILTVPAFGIFPNSNVVYRTEGSLFDLGFRQVFNGDKESFKCRLHSWIRGRTFFILSRPSIWGLQYFHTSACTKQFN